MVLCGYLILRSSFSSDSSALSIDTATSGLSGIRKLLQTCVVLSPLILLTKHKHRNINISQESLLEVVGHSEISRKIKALTLYHRLGARPEIKSRAYCTRSRTCCGRHYSRLPTANRFVRNLKFFSRRLLHCFRSQISERIISTIVSE